MKPELNQMLEIGDLLEEMTRAERMGLDIEGKQFNGDDVTWFQRGLSNSAPSALNTAVFRPRMCAE